MSSAGSDWKTNPATQIKWGLTYMNERYGSPNAAWAFWQATAGTERPVRHRTALTQGPALLTEGRGLRRSRGPSRGTGSPRARPHRHAGTHHILIKRITLIRRTILVRRILTAFVALLALQAGSLVAPAYACGCGAMIPDKARRIGVDREESAVRWDGRTETIVMRFSVHGDAERAAWIMPVPSRADVSLGDPELFDEIDRLTAPERRDRFHFWPREDDWPFDTGHGDGAGAAPGAGTGVGVVGRERLGPSTWPG